MKKMIFALLLLISFSSFAQKGIITYFDNAGNITSKEKTAATFKVVTKEDDTTFVEQYYQNYGPMIWQKTYKDENLNVLHGFSNWYNSLGECDSTIFYENDSTKSTRHLSFVSFKDGHKEKMLVDIFPKKIISDSTYQYYTTIDSTAKFSSGSEIDWVNYLKRNIDISIGKLIPKYKNIHDKKTAVEVSFLIKKNGDVTQVNVLYSSGYPFDTEVMRIIKNSPKWRPAYQNGKPISYRQKQRIYFSY